MLFLLSDSPQKLQLKKIHEKDSWKRIMKIILYVSLSSPQLERLLFLLKTQKNNHFSAYNRWEYTKHCFKENPKILSKNSTTQENITI